MSYDVDIRITNPRGETKSVYDSNYTYNVAEMFVLALEMERGLYGLDGITCSEALPILKKAVENFETKKVS